MLRLLLSAALLFSSGTPATRRTVSSIDYLGSYSASSRVSIWRGVAADIVIHGSLIDLTTGVEVRNSAGTTASGVTATVTDHIGGGDTRLFVRITSSSSAAAGNYKLLIHYLVEASGPDHVDLRLFNRGTVSSFSIVEPKTSGSYLVGQPYTLVASGSNLSGAALTAATSTQLSGLAVESTISTTSSEARFRVHFTTSSAQTVSSVNVYDGAMSSAPTLAQGSAAGFAGSGALSVFPALDDSIASMGPLVLDPGGTVTLSGPNLAPSAYTATVIYHVKGGGIASVPVTLSSSCTKTSGCTPTASFLPPRAARPDSMVLSFHPPTSGGPGLLRQSIPLPFPVYVKVPPDTLKTDTATSTGILVVHGGRSSHLEGQSLFSTAEVFAAGTPGVTRTPVAVSFNGQALTVQSLLRSNVAGDLRDELTFTPPSVATAQTGTLTITTAGGSKSLTVLFAPPPTVTSLTTAGPNGSIETLASGATLRTGTGYTIHGSNVAISGNGTSFFSIISPGNPSGGAGCCSSQSTGSVDFNPTSATSGQVSLVLRTLGGTVTVGTYKISAPFQMPAISSISAAPNPVIGGAATTATIAFGGAVTAGADTGFIDITTTLADIIPSVLRIPVLTNPLTVTVPTRIVGSTSQTNLSAVSSAGAASRSSAFTSLVIQPIQVTHVGLAPAVISGGHTVQANLTLNSNPGAGQSASVSILSSNPAVASVPATVTVSGSTASFNITTSVVGHTSPVTITVSLGGVTQTATLTVTPPVAQTISFSKSSIVSLDTATMIITLDAVPLAPDTVHIALSDTSVFGPLSTLVTSQQTVRIPFTARLVTAPHTATVNSLAAGIDPTATISLSPLSLTMTLSPSTTNAGVGVTATVTLNAPVNAPAGQSFGAIVTSSDTSVVSNSALLIGGLGFANRQTVVVFSVPTRSPQAQAKSTVITYKMVVTGSAGSAGSAINALLPTVSKTLSVNP